MNISQYDTTLQKVRGCFEIIFIIMIAIYSIIEFARIKNAIYEKVEFHTKYIYRIRDGLSKYFSVT